MDFNLIANLVEPINIMTVSFVTIASGTIGLFSRYKIFLLFSIGGYLTLIVEFQNYTGIVVSLIGAIIFNLWFATLGGRE